MRQTTTKKPKKDAGRTHVYAGSFYVYDQAELDLLREGAQLAKQKLSAFVVSAALREARRAVKTVLPEPG